MATIEGLRNSLIHKLQHIKDKELLAALDRYLSGSEKEEKIALSKAQIEMLQWSFDDLKNGRTISQEELFEEERKWLEGK